MDVMFSFRISVIFIMSMFVGGCLHPSICVVDDDENVVNYIVGASGDYRETLSHCSVDRRQERIRTLQRQKLLDDGFNTYILRTYDFSLKEICAHEIVCGRLWEDNYIVTDKKVYFWKYIKDVNNQRFLGEKLFAWDISNKTLKEIVLPSNEEGGLWSSCCELGRTFAYCGRGVVVIARTYSDNQDSRKSYAFMIDGEADELIPFTVGEKKCLRLSAESVIGCSDTRFFALVTREHNAMVIDSMGRHICTLKSQLMSGSPSLARTASIMFKWNWIGDSILAFGCFYEPIKYPIEVFNLQTGESRVYETTIGVCAINPTDLAKGLHLKEQYSMPIWIPIGY